MEVEPIASYVAASGAEKNVVASLEVKQLYVDRKMLQKCEKDIRNEGTTS